MSKKPTARSKGRHIPESIRCLLWGRAAGRCEFTGCNRPVSWHHRTKETVNGAEAAHIVGFSKDGPRGERKLSKKLAKDLQNLMLLCLTCHRTVDKNKAKYTVPLLRDMKKAHESRVNLVVGIDPSRESQVVLYGANVGDHASPLTFEKAASAMFPESFPAKIDPIILGMINSSFTDRSAKFWELESAHLTEMVKQRIRPQLALDKANRLSVFGFAPQPLLMLLGHLLSDIPETETFQLHREPADWKWRPDDGGGDPFKVTRPNTKGPAALVLSLSATIDDTRIKKVLGDDASIWRIDVTGPHNDFLGSREQLRAFRRTVRVLLDQIKAAHGEDATLHVFPAVPVAAAVDFGRVVMPKADLPLRIYDQQRDLGGFVRALDLGAAVPAKAGAL